jgi:hypothetical protein
MGGRRIKYRTSRRLLEINGTAFAQTWVALGQLRGPLRACGRKNGLARKGLRSKLPADGKREAVKESTGAAMSRRIFLTLKRVFESARSAKIPVAKVKLAMRSPVRFSIIIKCVD